MTIYLVHDEEPYSYDEVVAVKRALEDAIVDIRERVARTGRHYEVMLNTNSVCPFGMVFNGQHYGHRFFVQASELT